MQLCLIVTALLPALRPQLQDRVHPSILIAPSWRGKRIGGGSHPRVWLGKGWGFWINSFPSQLCAVGRLPAAEGVAK